MNWCQATLGPRCFPLLLWKCHGKAWQHFLTAQSTRTQRLDLFRPETIVHWTTDLSCPRFVGEHSNPRYLLTKLVSEMHWSHCSNAPKTVSVQSDWKGKAKAPVSKGVCIPNGSHCKEAESPWVLITHSLPGRESSDIREPKWNCFKMIFYGCTCFIKAHHRSPSQTRKRLRSRPCLFLHKTSGFHDWRHQCDWFVGLP